MATGIPLAPGTARTAAPPATVTLPVGALLLVAPGQELAARVLSAEPGRAELALAGRRLSARTDVPLAPGQTVALVVAEAGPDRVVLRLAGVPGPPAAPEEPLRAAGLAPHAARALIATAAESGAAPPTAGEARALAARALAAGVASPAEAVAFARLEGAGLPATPGAVHGLAALLDGPPLGRALEAVLLGARADATAARPVASSVTPAEVAAGPAPASTAPDPVPGPPPGPRAADTGAGGLAATLARIAGEVAAGAVGGDPIALRATLAALGHPAASEAPGGPARDSVRTRLYALAAHPAVAPTVARDAERLAHAIGAQGLAGAALPPPPEAGPAPAPGQAGLYLQLPLPGGQTAEVRVQPDGDAGGPAGVASARRIAFLLHLSALGPLVVEAAVGPRGADAVVRTSSPEAQAFVAQRADDLRAALRRRGEPSSPVRVTVERLAGPPPSRLLAPPPATGLDLRA
jgi:hypothetical protein